MRYVDEMQLSLKEHLALDETLLNQAEESDSAGDVLRIWEADSRAVVVGRASRVEDEVNVECCRAEGIPIYRRTSGGAAVLLGPGCLVYSLVLNYGRDPQLRRIDRAHRLVMRTMLSAVRPFAAEALWQGTCDLTIGNRKFSGNSLRCRRNSLLYHGTLLYRFDLKKIGAWLRLPPRTPDYRRGRSHREFLVNMPVDRETLVASIRRAWHADEALGEVPLDAARALAEEKYSRDVWNMRR